MAYWKTDSGFGPFWSRILFLPQTCGTRKQVLCPLHLYIWLCSQCLLSFCFKYLLSCLINSLLTVGHVPGMNHMLKWPKERLKDWMKRTLDGFLKIWALLMAPLWISGRRQQTFFCKGPEKKYFWLLELYSLSGNCSTQPLQCKSSHWPCINKGMGLTCKLYWQNVKATLNSWSGQKQATSKLSP